MANNYHSVEASAKRNREAEARLKAAEERRFEMTHPMLKKTRTLCTDAISIALEAVYKECAEEVIKDVKDILMEELGTTIKKIIKDELTTQIYNKVQGIKNPPNIGGIINPTSNGLKDLSRPKGPNGLPANISPNKI